MRHDESSPFRLSLNQK